MEEKDWYKKPIIWVLFLGYLIDFFDLTIFAVSRIQCLEYLKIPKEDMLSASVLIFNVQALGLVLGGLVFGIWGDKLGRISSVKYGILTFSLATLLTVFTTHYPLFVLLRFIAYVGLAGEFAASATYITEYLDNKSRSLATSALYSFGIIGGILASLLGHFFDWKVLFTIGGLLGFLLMFLRSQFLENSLFIKMKDNPLVKRGQLSLLFKFKTLKKMIFLILIGVPFWFLAYCVNFAPELSSSLTNGKFKISQSLSLFYFLLGSLVGNILISYLTIKLKSRKKPILVFFLLIPFAVIFYIYSNKLAFSFMYMAIFFIGTFTGYCSTFITFITESFGTNMRSTASCLISNLVRLSIVFINSFVPFFIASVASTSLGLFLSSLIFMLIGVFPLLFLIDTFHKNIDFQEAENN